jgi:hypothetical protein
MPAVCFALALLLILTPSVARAEGVPGDGLVFLVVGIPAGLLALLVVTAVYFLRKARQVEAEGRHFRFARSLATTAFFAGFVGPLLAWMLEIVVNNEQYSSPNEGLLALAVISVAIGWVAYRGVRLCLRQAPGKKGMTLAVVGATAVLASALVAAGLFG